ncbi:hypothetical protein ACVWW1_008504 [Bradyrhizobium sp. JR3.5]
MSSRTGTHRAGWPTDGNTLFSRRGCQTHALLDAWSDHLDDIGWIDIADGNHLNIASRSAGEVDQAPHPNSAVNHGQSVAVRCQRLVEQSRHITRGDLARGPKCHFSPNARIDDDGHAQNVAHDVIHNLPNIGIGVVEAHASAIGCDRQPPLHRGGDRPARRLCQQFKATCLQVSPLRRRAPTHASRRLLKPAEHRVQQSSRSRHIG